MSIANEQEMGTAITKTDFEMAMNIVNHSNETSFILADGKNEKDKRRLTLKQKIPQPENMNIDFLVKHNQIVKRICKNERVPLSTITGNTMYPVINKEKGSDVAMRFVNGLCSEGFGEITYNEEAKMLQTFSPRR